MELEHAKAIKDMLLLDETPRHDKFGIDNAKLIAPRDPARSILLNRLARRGKGQMPPLASSIPDDRAVALFRQWIEQLEVKSDHRLHLAAHRRHPTSTITLDAPLLRSLQRSSADEPFALLGPKRPSSGTWLEDRFLYYSSSRSIVETSGTTLSPFIKTTASMY